jgi:hypothetical protein
MYHLCRLHLPKQIIDAIKGSKQWNRTLIAITFDDNGGRWDHQAPPVKDRWGPGTRVPTMFVSTNVRKQYVEHQYYDSTAIMKLIEERWNLLPIGTRDRDQAGFETVFVNYSYVQVGYASYAFAIFGVAFAVVFGIGVLYMLNRRKQAATQQDYQRHR